MCDIKSFILTKEKLVFKYDGKVYPCEAFKEVPNNNLFILGDIYKDELEKIWNNYKYLICLKELKNEITDDKKCPAQIYMEKCNGL